MCMYIHITNITVIGVHVYTSVTQRAFPEVCLLDLCYIALAINMYVQTHAHISALILEGVYNNICACTDNYA